MNKGKLKKCRFYHGEARCLPSARSSIFFWVCERDWVSRSDDFSEEIQALKQSGQDDFAVDEYGTERIPLTLLAVIYSKLKPGWSLLRMLRIYFGLDSEGSYSLVEKIPTHLVSRDGKTEEVEDDSWWQAFVGSAI